MTKALVLHPFLFALYPILFVYGQNLPHLSPSSAWSSILVLLGATVVSWLLFSLILRDAIRAGLLTSFFSMLLFSFGPVRRMLPPGEAVTLILLGAWALILIGGAALVLRTRRDLGKANQILYTLEHLRDAIELPSPRFVFTHVLGTHAPLVFDAQGNEI